MKPESSAGTPAGGPPENGSGSFNPFDKEANHVWNRLSKEEQNDLQSQTLKRLEIYLGDRPYGENDRFDVEDLDQARRTCGKLCSRKGSDSSVKEQVWERLLRTSGVTFEYIPHVQNIDAAVPGMPLKTAKTPRVFECLKQKGRHPKHCCVIVKRASLAEVELVQVSTPTSVREQFFCQEKNQDLKHNDKEQISLRQTQPSSVDGPKKRVGNGALPPKIQPHEY